MQLIDAHYGETETSSEEEEQAGDGCVVSSETGLGVSFPRPPTGNLF